MAGAEFRSYNDLTKSIARIALESTGEHMTLDPNRYTVEMHMTVGDDFWERYIALKEGGKRAAAYTMLLDLLEPVMALSDPYWTREKLARNNDGFLEQCAAFFNQRILSEPSEDATSETTTGSATASTPEPQLATA